MEEIKDFLFHFFEKEKLAYYLRLRPNIDVYNDAYENMNTFLVKALHNQMGLIRINTPESDDFYSNYENMKVFNPRNLYKISEYNHSKYGNVWIAYSSNTNPDLRIKILSHALFIIREQSKLKVARVFIYSNKRGNNNVFDWEGLNGIQDLNFETLGNLVKIERILEPLNYKDSLKLYLEEK